MTLPQVLIIQIHQICTNHTFRILIAWKSLFHRQCQDRNPGQALHSVARIEQ